MGLKFRKSYKIAPGVKVNINKKSSSVSFGGKGVHHSISSTGRKTTSVGIPGSGIGYTHSSGKRSKKDDVNSPFIATRDYYEYVNPEYREFLTDKEYSYYVKCTRNGLLFDEDPEAILTQSGKRNSRLVYTVCYFISLILSLLLFLFALVGFTISIPFGIIFLACAAVIYLSFRGYRKIAKIHKKISDNIGSQTIM